MSDIAEIEAHRDRAQAAYDKLPLSGPVTSWCELYGEDLLDSCTKLLAALKQRTELIDAAAGHWLESCRTTNPPIPWEGAIDGAMEAACKEVKRLRARLEVHESGYDGISCRDETIRNQDAIIDNLRARVAELEAELSEQSRLHGMGSEREARLMARVAELERAQDDEVLASASPSSSRREWGSGSAWLYPGDRIVVIRSP